MTTEPFFFDELERRRAEIARHRENRARVAQEFHKVETTGLGFIEIEDCLEFDITFIEEPYVHYGTEIDLEELGELLGTDVDGTPPLPLVTGMVTDWDIDQRGFYRGAWCAARIYYPPEDAIPVDAQVVVRHHFTFTAIGIKDIPVGRVED